MCVCLWVCIRQRWWEPNGFNSSRYSVFELRVVKWKTLFQHVFLSYRNVFLIPPEEPKPILWFKRALPLLSLRLYEQSAIYKRNSSTPIIPVIVFNVLSTINFCKLHKPIRMEKKNAGMDFHGFFIGTLVTLVDKPIKWLSSIRQFCLWQSNRNAWKFIN